MTLEMERKIYEVNPGEIKIPENRDRQEFDKLKMKKLAESLAETGQIQPGVCRIDEEGDYSLVVGERRLRASEMAEVPFKFTLIEETNPLMLKVIELEENLCRVNLNWKEEAIAVEKLHATMQELHGQTEVGKAGGHRIKDTARFLERSVGNIAEAIEIAKLLDVPEVSDSRNLSDAKKTIKRLKEEYDRAESLKAAKEAATRARIERYGDSEEDEVGDAIEATSLAQTVLMFSEQIQLGKMEDVLESQEDSQYHVVCFDPPWGVDYDTVGELQGDKVSFEDSVEAIVKNLENWLQLIYRKMAEESHLYLFFGISNYTFIYETLHKVGFETNGIPLIWYKQGAHRTRNPDIWPGRAYEPIAYARKGKKILIRKGAPDVIITPAPKPSMKNLHPAAKHPDIYIELLRRSAMPGDKILDPMCGSGMFAVAAETMRPTHQLDWTMIEMSETYYDLALSNVVKGYHKIVNVEFRETQEAPTEAPLPFFTCYKCGHQGESATLLPNHKGDKALCPECEGGVRLLSKLAEKDFREIDLDSEFGQMEWKAFWKANPEKQDEMLKWKAERRTG
uniref:Putative methyltransferase n=2 Tax=viral metagenome TaxID=1070528 RepID=A0A6M3L6H4_9ZZZZ